MEDRNICGIDEKKLEASVLLLKSLLNKKSRNILALLDKYGECSVTHVQEKLDMVQPVVSTYLTKLKKLGVLESRKDAHFILYKISRKKIKSINKSISYIKYG